MPEAALPTFFIPGAAKGGTSSLHEMLDGHPEIVMSRPKELHVYSHPVRSRVAASIYARAFSGRTGMHRGESSTSYLVSESAADRIAKAIPTARFICILRDPVARIVSHYNWLRAQGLEWRNLRAAVRADAKLEYDILVDYGGNYRYYLAYSRYGEHIRRLHRRFGKESVLVVTTERLREDPAGVARDCCRFLGVNEFRQLPHAWENRTPEAPWPKARALLWSATYRIPVFGRVPRRVGRLTRAALGRLAPAEPSGAGHPSVTEEDRAWLASELAEDRAILEAQLNRSFPEWC